MNWFVVYFFVTSQIYPHPSMSEERAMREHARRSCATYNGAFFDRIESARERGEQYGRVGYVYTARCYLYDFKRQR